MKKLLTILLSVLLVMSLVLPAMASTPMITGQIVTVKTAQPDLTGIRTTCTARWRAMPTFPR